MLKTLLLYLLLIPVAVCAQNSITGKVISLADKKPIPDASVFLSNASVGNKTADDGSFTLNNIKNGQYDLVVSCVGYEAFHQTILVNGTPITIPKIELVTKTTELKEVKIKYDPDRAAHLKLFVSTFIGQTDNARKCTIINPDIIDLDYDKTTGILTASTDDFLIIENKSLGYRIKYLLNKFLYNPHYGRVYYTGPSIFEPLTGKESEQKRWNKNRLKAYLGSDMHFLRSCISNTVEKEGFEVRAIPHRIRTAQLNIPAQTSLAQTAQAQTTKPTALFDHRLLQRDEYITTTDKQNVWAVAGDNILQITYLDDPGHRAFITLLKPQAYFDNNGVLMDPDSTTLMGYWAELRIADLLPVDYQAPLKK